MGDVSANSPVLIGCSHGTRDLGARAVVRALLDAVRAELRVDVREAFVDVQDPKVKEVVSGVPLRTKPSAGLAVVVVPLFVSRGYHVAVDIGVSVRGRDDAVACPALGPDPVLIDIVLDRLRESGVTPGTALVLAAAGSSDRDGRADAEAATADLASRWPGPVTVGYAAGARPTVAHSVEQAREVGAEVVAVASYLLIPGDFQGRLASAGADVVTGPLAPDSRIVELICARYRAAIAVATTA